MHSPAPREYCIAPSRVLRVGLVCLHIAAALAIALCLDGYLLLMALCLLAVSGFYYLGVAKIFGAGKVLRYRDGEWLVGEDEYWRVFQCSTTTVWRWVTVLVLIDENQRRHYLPVLFDQLPADDFRSLRAVARFCHLSQRFIAPL
ncbi:MAG: protein YgfX [Spongiibacteraceae bacterium]